MDTNDNTESSQFGASCYLGGATEVATALVVEPAPEVVAAVIAEIIPPTGTTLLYPAGKVDFNKPIAVVDLHDEDKVLNDATIVTILKGSSYPILVAFWDDGEQMVSQFDENGTDINHDYKVENVVLGERTQFLALIAEGRNVTIDGLYATENEAKASNDWHDLIGVFPITFDPTLRPFKPDPAPALDDAFASSTDDGIEAEESDEEIEDTEENTVSTAPEMVTIGYRTLRVGDNVSFYRRSHGVRWGTVIKLRSDPHKAVYFRANDGTEPYWARNANIR